MGFTYISKRDELGILLSHLYKSKLCGFDVEATDLDPFNAKLLLIQLNLDGEIFILDCLKLTNGTIKYIISIIKDTNKLCIGHNIKYDIKIIFHNTQELLTNVYDTMLSEILTKAGINDRYVSLNDLTQKYENVFLDKKVRETFYNYDKDYFTNEQILYAAEDVQYLLSIREKQLKLLENVNQTHIANLENELVPVFSMMEYQGIDIDKDIWMQNSKQHSDLAKKEHEELLDYIIENIDIDSYKNALEICQAINISKTHDDINVKTKRYQSILIQLQGEYAKQWIKENINLDSPTQMLNIFHMIGFKDIESTSEKALQEFKGKHVLVDKLLKYREDVKKVGTYGENFLNNINKVTGRIHTSLNQLGTATGRISSDHPNLQNIPVESDYRKAFIAPQGYKLIKADYSQAELRLFAEISNEIEMINSFNNNEDLHARSAAFLFNKNIKDVAKDERQKGKTLNFGVVYGISEYGLFYNFGIPLEEGREYLLKYYSGYKFLKKCIDNAGKIIWQKKFSITPLGRKRFFEDIVLYKDDKEIFRYKSRVIREGVNHIIQGGIADVVKIAMKNCFYRNPFGDGLKLLLQVHDEILFLVKDEIVEQAEKFIKEIMISSGELFIKKIPVIVDSKISQNW